MSFLAHFSVVYQRKKSGLGRRELLDVIRSKPVFKKKIGRHTRPNKTVQNLPKSRRNRDFLANQKKKKNLLRSNDPPETELSYDIRYVTRGYVSHSESIPE